MKPTDVITALINAKYIPECACDLRYDRKGNIEYLHPTKGWKRVSIVRITDFLTKLYRAYMKQQEAAQ